MKKYCFIILSFLRIQHPNIRFPDKKLDHLSSRTWEKLFPLFAHIEIQFCFFQSLFLYFIGFFMNFCKFAHDFNLFLQFVTLRQYIFLHLIEHFQGLSVFLQRFFTRSLLSNHIIIFSFIDLMFQITLSNMQLFSLLWGQT